MNFCSCQKNARLASYRPSSPMCPDRSKGLEWSMEPIFCVAILKYDRFPAEQQAFFVVSCDGRIVGKHLEDGSVAKGVRSCYIVTVDPQKTKNL